MPNIHKGSELKAKDILNSEITTRSRPKNTSWVPVDKELTKFYRHRYAVLDTYLYRPGCLNEVWSAEARKHLAKMDREASKRIRRPPAKKRKR